MAEVSNYEIRSLVMLSGATGTGASDALDKGPLGQCTVQLEGTGATTNTATVKIEGSADGTNWFSLPYRTPSSDTSSNGDITLTDATVELYFVDPKWVRYVRVNVSANASNVPVKATAWAVY